MEGITAAAGLLKNIIQYNVGAVTFASMRDLRHSLEADREGAPMIRSIAMLPMMLLLVSPGSPEPVLERKVDTKRSCVLQSSVAAPTVREDGQVYFRGQPDPNKSYVAVFKGGSCPGMNRFATVAIETTGTGYCEGDKVRALNLPSTIPGPVCILDHLEPVAAETGH